MRTGVPKDIYALLIPRRDNRQIAVVLDSKAGIDQRIVDSSGKRGRGEPRPNRCCDLGNRYRLFKCFLRAIGQSDGGHCLLLSSDDPYQRPCVIKSFR